VQSRRVEKLGIREMRFKTRYLIAVGCISLLAMSIPAFSLPSQHGVAHPPRAQHATKGHAKAHATRANRAARLTSTPVSDPPKRPMFGWPVLVSEARKYIGTNPTDRKRLWCATFMNLVLKKLGYAGTNSDAAKSFSYYGRRISEPKIGAIAVLTRGKNGGHVGVVTGIDSHGNPIIVSGNHGHRVGEATYSRARVIAYVMPTERRPVNDTQVAEYAARTRAPEPARASEPPRPSESGLESPIAELLAAIEAEQNRPEAKAQPARPPEPPTPHRTVQQLPERAPQIAQQPVQHPAPQAAQQTARRELRRDLPLDPALAALLGIKERASPAQPLRPAPQRQQPVQQRSGRIASVDTGLAGRSSVPR
jgi:uncharacterized protein (TIGR02594 family)